MDATSLSPTDAELLERARRGDRDALEHLLTRHQDRVYRFGVKVCGDPEDAKDVLQETLLAAARSLRDFRGGSSLATWLYTIAHRFCLRARRKSTFAPTAIQSLDDGPGGAPIEIASDERPPDQEAAAREVRAALEAAIRALPADQREVLVLRDVEGLKATEVGQVLELSVPAVKSRLHRARLAVREALAVRLGQVEPPPAAGCPEVSVTFSRYLEGDIGPEVCAAMEKHLAGCAHCTATCDSLRRILRLCRTSPEQPVPEDVQQSVREALRALAT